MSRIVAERKTLGTARYFYRDGAAHLPRACVSGTRASGTRGDETPQQAPQGVYVHTLAIQGGGTAEWKRGNKDGSAARRLSREYPSRSAARRGLRTAAVIETTKHTKGEA